MLQENRRSRRTVFRKRNYSFSKDFFLFILVIGISVFVFYRLIYKPIFGVPDVTDINAHAIYEVRETRGNSEIRFVQKIWHYGESVFVENAALDSVVKYIYSGDSLYQQTEEGTRKLERALNPLFLPFSPALYRFIESNESYHLDLKIFSDSAFAGRDAVECEFKDWFKSDREYRFIFDKKTYLPLFIEVREDGGKIFSAEATFFFDEIRKEEKPFRLSLKGAKDVFVNSRLEASEVQYSVPFSVYPPGWVPADLNRMQILRLERYRLPLSSVSFNTKSILFSFYNEEEFLHVLEFKGNFPAETVKPPPDFQVKGRNFKAVAVPGAFLVWGQDGNVTIAIVTNLSIAEIRRVIEGLFE